MPAPRRGPFHSDGETNTETATPVFPAPGRTQLCSSRFAATVPVSSANVPVSAPDFRSPSCHSPVADRDPFAVTEEHRPGAPVKKDGPVATLSRRRRDGSFQGCCPAFANPCVCPGTARVREPTPGGDPASARVNLVPAYRTGPRSASDGRVAASLPRALVKHQTARDRPQTCPRQPGTATRPAAGLPSEPTTNTAFAFVSQQPRKRVARRGGRKLFLQKKRQRRLTSIRNSDPGSPRGSAKGSIRLDGV